MHIEPICSHCRKPTSGDITAKCPNCSYQHRLTAYGESIRREKHPELMICPVCKQTVLDGETVCYDDMGQIHHSLCYLQSNKSNESRTEKL